MLTLLIASFAGLSSAFGLLVFAVALTDLFLAGTSARRRTASTLELRHEPTSRISGFPA